MLIRCCRGRYTFKSSSDVFNKLTAMFTNPDIPLNHELEVLADAAAPGRLVSHAEENSGWLVAPSDATSDFRNLQDFTKNAIGESKRMVANLRYLSKQLVDEHLTASVDYYYVPPRPENIADIDPKGIRYRDGVVQFQAADTNGLVVPSPRREGPGFGRVTEAENGFIAIPGTQVSSFLPLI